MGSVNLIDWLATVVAVHIHPFGTPEPDMPCGGPSFDERSGSACTKAQRMGGKAYHRQLSATTALQSSCRAPRRSEALFDVMTKVRAQSSRDITSSERHRVPLYESAPHAPASAPTSSPTTPAICSSSPLASSRQIKSAMTSAMSTPGAT